MFLDNVTVILLITPIIIRICEVADLNPIPILIIVIMSCNICGVGTPMGDPPNIMIISNAYLLEKVDHYLKHWKVTILLIVSYNRV